MRRLAYLAFTIATFVAISCGQGKSEWPAKVVNLDPSVLDGAKQLSLTYMGWNNEQILDAKKFYPIDDGHVLVLTAAKTSNAYLYICDASSHEVTDTLFIKGNGPGEALSYSLFPGKRFVFKDFVKQNLYAFDAKDILTNPESIESIDYPKLGAASTLLPMEDGTVIYENTYCSHNFKDRYVEQYPRLVRSRTDATQKYGKDYEAVYNVSQGLIDINPESGKIVYASLNASIVEFYDKDLSPLLRIQGPLNPRISYYVTTTESSFYDCFPDAYREMCCTSKYIYLVYLGICPSLEEYDSAGDYKRKSYMMRYDWDGNLVDCHSLDGVPSSIYVRDGEDQRVFLTMKDEDGGCALYYGQIS